jgi:apolipoprotein N-acyltransferase
MKLFRELFDRPPLLALIPAIAVVFDYSMTLLHSGGRDAIMAFEYSPILRTAVAGNMLLPCLAALAIGYYSLSYLALDALHGSRYYPFGVLLVLLVGFTHFSGGFSWIVRNSAYSQGVLLIAAAGVAVALSAFLLAVKRRRAEATPAP